MNKTKRKMPICHLCGKDIAKDKTKEHVPPKQFFPLELRSRYNPNLLTLPTHGQCNKSYRDDEDYFVASLGPLAMDSGTGGALWNDLKVKFGREKGQGLFNRIHGEFVRRPSGLYLPSGKVQKNVDSYRMERVLWKILAGLYYWEVGKVLPRNVARSFYALDIGEAPPEHLQIILAQPSRGRYPAIFDYKYSDENDNTVMNAWAFLFWDRLIFFVLFHKTTCTCDLCAAKLPQSDSPSP